MYMSLMHYMLSLYICLMIAPAKSEGVTAIYGMQVDRLAYLGNSMIRSLHRG